MFFNKNKNKNKNKKDKDKDKIIINQNDNVLYNGSIFSISSNSNNSNLIYTNSWCTFKNILTLSKNKFRNLLGINLSEEEQDNAIMNLIQKNDDLYLIIKDCKCINLENLTFEDLEITKENNILTIRKNSKFD